MNYEIGLGVDNVDSLTGLKRLSKVDEMRPWEFFHRHIPVQYIAHTRRSLLYHATT